MNNSFEKLDKLGSELIVSLLERSQEAARIAIDYHFNIERGIEILYMGGSSIERAPNDTSFFGQAKKIFCMIFRPK